MSGTPQLVRKTKTKKEFVFAKQGTVSIVVLAADLYDALYEMRSMRLCSYYLKEVRHPSIRGSL